MTLLETAKRVASTPFFGVDAVRVAKGFLKLRRELLKLAAKWNETADNEHGHALEELLKAYEA